MSTARFQRLTAVAVRKKPDFPKPVFFAIVSWSAMGRLDRLLWTDGGYEFEI